MEASEDETKGYHAASDDGRRQTTYEERSKMRHLRENVTTATMISDTTEDGGKVGGGPKGAKGAVPVIATETRKMAYTETKVK